MTRLNRLAKHLVPFAEASLFLGPLLLLRIRRSMTRGQLLMMMEVLGCGLVIARYYA